MYNYYNPYYQNGINGQQHVLRSDHPFPPYPYTSQNIVRYPYSYPYVYQAPYINHPLYQVQQQDRPTYDISGLWDTKFGREVGKEPQIPLNVFLYRSTSDTVGGYYNRPGSSTSQGTLEGRFSGNTLTGTWDDFTGIGTWGYGNSI